MKNTNDHLSHWEKEVFFDPYELIVVGAGIVGLSAAIYYKQENPRSRVCVVDAAIFPKGASSRNAGFACFGSMTELLADIASNGIKESLALVQSRWQGLASLRSLVGDENMDYLNTGGYEIFLQKDKAIFHETIKHIKEINARLESIIGIPEVFKSIDQTFGMKNIAGIIFNSAEGQLHPGKMMKKLIQLCQKNEIDIHRGYTVKEYKSEKEEVSLCSTNNESLQAKKLLFATNGFSKNILPDLNVQPARNQVILTQPIPQLKLKGCFHYDQGYVYFRNVGQSLLIGGGRHWDIKKEETAEYGENDLIKNKLLKLVEENILPGLEIKIKDSWSGILGVGKEKSPIIKFIAPNVLLSIRMGGMGVAIGNGVGRQAAKLLSEI